MQSFTIEEVRGWHIVSAASGRIVGVHSTAEKAGRQVAAINLKRRQYDYRKDARGSAK